MAKSTLSNSLLIGFALFILLSPVMIFAEEKAEGKYCIEKNYLPVVKTVKWLVTAYSSSIDETDDTPDIGAFGQKVFDGMLANNGLPPGTKVRMPELFGNKILIVADRMHERKGTAHGDVWMSSKEQAKQFGAKWNVKVEILES